MLSIYDTIYTDLQTIQKRYTNQREAFPGTGITNADMEAFTTPRDVPEKPLVCTRFDACSQAYLITVYGVSLTTAIQTFQFTVEASQMGDAPIKSIAQSIADKLFYTMYKHLPIPFSIDTNADRIQIIAKAYHTHPLHRVMKLHG